VQWGWVIGYFFAMLAFMAIFHKLSQETNPVTKLFFCENGTHLSAAHLGDRHLLQITSSK
jgi:hypothetical protein